MGGVRAFHARPGSRRDALRVYGVGAPLPSATRRRPAGTSAHGSQNEQVPALTYHGGGGRSGEAVLAAHVPVWWSKGAKLMLPLTLSSLALDIAVCSKEPSSVRGAVAVASAFQLLWTGTCMKRTITTLRAPAATLSVVPSHLLFDPQFQPHKHNSLGRLWHVPSN